MRTSTRDTAGSAGWAAATVVLCLLAIALIPRSILVGDFVTVDESVHWFDRSRDFLSAIRAGDAPGTYLTGHPGVTTMWLGAAGRVLYEQLHLAGDVWKIRMMRLPVAFVTALCVALAYLPLRRLLGGRIAFLAALLWATDPFLTAHSQLLHVDALLTSFLVLALLFGLVAFRLDEPAPATARPRLPWLIASAISGGLALLTKSPALALLPSMAAIALLGAWRAPGRPGMVARVSPIVPALLAWGLVAAALWFALWPAARADLPGVLQRVISEAEENGGTPHGTGSFLLGQHVPDPGPLFYPLALTLRLTPWATIGILAALGALRSWPASDQRRRTLAFLAGFSVVFVIVLTLMAKKFDRYALPIMPLLQIIAACGLVWLFDAAARLVARAASPNRGAGGRWGWLAGCVLVGGLGLNLASYHPYELAYYNPLLGGGAVAQRTVPVGWGEGYELAARYVAGRPDGCARSVAVWYRSLVDHMVCGPTIRMSDFAQGEQAGYVILYIDQLQRGYYHEGTQKLWGVLEPMHTIQIAGIDYAYIYQMPPPTRYQVDAMFGPNVRLRGYNVETDQLDRTGMMTITLEWQAQEQIDENESIFLHVLDRSGRKIAQVDVPLGGVAAPSSSWMANEYVTQVQAVPLPTELPPDKYWIVVGVYDPVSTRRIPLDAPPQAANIPSSGPDSLTLGAFSP